jgi:hypothetical protein
MADVRLGLEPKDYHLINKTPDPDFSPERNKAVVMETIADNEKLHKMMLSMRDKELENRIDIMASYGNYKLNYGKGKNIREYLGEEQYKAIIGEHLMEKLRVAQATNRLNGNKHSSILL